MIKLLISSSSQLTNRSCGLSLNSNLTHSTKAFPKSNFFFKKISDPKKFDKQQVPKDKKKLKENFTKEKDQLTNSNFQSNKQDSLIYFKRVSDRILVEFENFPFLSSLRHLNMELFRNNRNQPLFMGLKSNIKKSNDFINNLKYLKENLSEFSTKEKAILFKMLSMLYDKDKDILQMKPLVDVLLTLEIDYYKLDLNELSLIDLVNYKDAFNYYRETNIIHFQTFTTDHIFKKNLNFLEAFFEQKGK